ncbi:MAG: EAL domain-containing protein, partial [Xanthomonadales bacterium]|nr:EAL domain-containing protein [Xanthomonadales bacterium]
QYDSTAREALEGLAKMVQIIPTDVEGNAIAAVHEGKADFALVPIEIGYKSIIDHDYHDIVAISPPLLECQYAYAVKRGNAALLAQINAGLAQVHSNGTLDKLYMKWLANLDPHAVTSARSRWLAWTLAGLLAFFALVIGLWLRARGQAKTQTHLAATESSSRIHAEAQVEHLAWHDAATDLPNLNALLSRMHEAVSKSQRFGLVRIDILRLDLAQATAGSRFTDELLLALAQRLQQACSHGSVAALGRGQFAVMLEPLDGHREANQRMRALVDTVHQPLQLDDIVLQQRCRAGLAYFPLDANDAEGMLRAAETACSAAHEQAVTMLNYVPQLEPDPRNLTLLADLAQAINDGSLGYALQPKFSLNDCSFCGAELLARWDHPRYGALAPDQFVPLAEKTGAISSLTLYVVRAAVIQWQRWRARGITLHIAVNISVNDLADETLVARIVSLCHQIGPALTLEITETEMIRDPQRALAALARLRSTGMRISLDDFGTGHSSLTYLRQLSPNEVKIDRSFISRMLTSSDDQAIVLACIALAHELDTKVVAEGVEDQATLDWLAEHGCDIAQGYVLAKPMPPDALFERYACDHVT